jgi:OOP family OmpA-OmpF porin
MFTATALRGASASAADGFDLQRFHPSERGSSWFVLESLDLRGHGRPAFGAVFDYQREPLVLRSGDGSVRAALVDHVLTAHLGGGVTLFDRVRLAANLPVVLSTDGTTGTLRGTAYAPPQDGTTLGDAHVGVDARLFGRHDGPLTMALGARLFLPTGSPSSYTGDGSVRFAPHVLAAGNVSLFTYAARAGVMVRNPDAQSFTVGTELLYAASAGVRVVDGRLTVGPELFGSTDLSSDPGKTRTSPLEALVGAHYALPMGVRFGAGVGAGIVSGYGSPQVRGLASVEWMPEIAADADGDGVPDAEDACPRAAGIRSAEPSKNGCPPPPPSPDADGDGIPDAVDACMDVRGKATNDPRTNGCIDRDGDGILDPLDHCPFLAGPPSNDPNQNGCPNRDKDGDGVLDVEDACPDTAGVKSSDPKTNGCPPNVDRDRDGIPNDKDACPDQAGAPDPNPTRNGCPAAFVDGGQIRVRQQVQFTGNTAVIQPGQESQDVLEGILDVLQTHSAIARLHVEGHTDNRGDPKKNLKLSRDRAAAIVSWLAAHGVDKARLTSEGFGGTRPIDSNDTEEGRQNNRRIELRIEQVDPLPPAGETK